MQPAAQIVEHHHQPECDRHAEQQHQQGLVTLAREHPVEDLQHEQRGRQQQQVDEKGEARDEKQRAFEELEERFHGQSNLPPAPSGQEVRIHGITVKSPTPIEGWLVVPMIAKRSRPLTVSAPSAS